MGPENSAPTTQERASESDVRSELLLNIDFTPTCEDLLDIPRRDDTDIPDLVFSEVEDEVLTQTFSTGSAEDVLDQVS